MTTQTYAETKGKKPFDWNAFLKKENKLQNEIEKAKALAYDWVTCACGNQCDVILRSALGEPYDFKLYQLGMDFSSSIYFNRYTKAQSVLMQIEQRSAELIAEINKNA